MAFRSRPSSQSFYITYAYDIISLLSPSLLPNRCFPAFGSLSLTILGSPADPPTLRNRIRLSIRLRILLLAPRMFWTHGSAAASAKRTEIRHSASGTRWRVWFRKLPLTSLCTFQVLIACEKRSKLTSELVSY